MLIKKNYFEEEKKNNYSIAIGNFDGIHKGHRFLLKELNKFKKLETDKIGVLSFVPHPVKVLAPNKWRKNLIKFRTKYLQLKSQNIDTLFLVTFNKSFSNLSAENFIEDILLKKININNIIVGKDFKFGNNREGDITLLGKYAKKNKFKLLCFEKKKSEDLDEVYSSSLIRDLIRSGEIVHANKLLGYKWEVTGKVIKGKAKGRELGYPTANLKYSYQIAPSKGIYACWTNIEGTEKWYKSAVSTGVRPHYKGVEEILEVYIFNFSGNLYQKRIRVAFVSKIRNEEVFNNEEDLIDKMKKDCVKVESILSKNFIIENNKGLK